MIKMTRSVDDVARRYCERYGCSSDAFEMSFFWNSIPRPARPLAYAIYAVAPGFFRLDFRYLRRIAQAESRHEFAVLANALRYEPDFSRGFLRGFLRVRVSGRRLARIAASIFNESSRKSVAEQQHVSMFFDGNSAIEKAA